MEKTKIILISQRCCTQPFVVVGSIIERNKKFLLVQEGGKWNQPIGWLELREDIIDGAKRETEEETGLKVKITGFLGVYSLIKDKEGKVLHAIKFIFTAKPCGEKKNFTTKLKTRWFSYNEIQEMKNKNQLWDPDLPVIIDNYLKDKIYPIEITSNFKIVSE
ncbi:MAG TPA: NUDIX domain-containing protein [bacterium]|nr:NUDIX domain-containing protein [bacterium]HPL83641.1 NUDIX domain-containing protein [bacterium]